MFNLINTDGNVELICDVVGYQFPDDMDDNWCLLKVSVIHLDNTCELIDPALETTELIQLLEWFSCLAGNGFPKCLYLSFIEPCISFEFLAIERNFVRIAIHLKGELKPSFKLKQLESESNTWSLIFDLGEGELEQVVAGINAATQHYPVRCG